MPRPPTTLSHRAAHVMTTGSREASAGHGDPRERAELLYDVDCEVTHRQLTSAVVHEALGLPPGALSDGSLSTDVLRAVLAHVRALPHLGWHQ